MSEVAVSARGLGKLYFICERESYTMLRDGLTRALTAPLRLLKGKAPRTVSGLDAHTKVEFIWAVKDASFDLKQGEVVGIIGSNGSGKSTLLKIISRITEPTEGEARIYGRVGSLLEVGTGFHPELSGRENIYLNGAILGMRKAEIDRQFNAIVEFAEIEKFLDMPVKHYSSGMYTRLAFSVAAHLDPEILVVDEVLAVGDAAFQKSVWVKWATWPKPVARCFSSATTWRWLKTYVVGQSGLIPDVFKLTVSSVMSWQNTFRVSLRAPTRTSA